MTVHAFKVFGLLMSDEYLFIFKLSITVPKIEGDGLGSVIKSTSTMVCKKLPFSSLSSFAVKKGYSGGGGGRGCQVMR